MDDSLTSLKIFFLDINVYSVFDQNWKSIELWIRKNRIDSLQFRGIINIDVEHQGNTSFVQMYLVEFNPKRMINGNKEKSTCTSN